MRQVSSRYTRTSRSFTLTSLGCLVSVCRPCWCNPGSSSTPRIYRRPVPESARGMQQFLTDSPWDDDAAVGRLQEYLRTQLEHPEGVWVWTAATFPSGGRSLREWQDSTVGGWARRDGATGRRRNWCWRCWSGRDGSPQTTPSGCRPGFTAWPVEPEGTTPGLPGTVWSPKAQTGGWAAADDGGAQQRIARRYLAGDQGGQGKPGAPQV